MSSEIIVMNLNYIYVKESNTRTIQDIEVKSLWTLNHAKYFLNFRANIYSYITK